MRVREGMVEIRYCIGSHLKFDEDCMGIVASEMVMQVCGCFQMRVREGMVEFRCCIGSHLKFDEECMGIVASEMVVQV